MCMQGWVLNNKWQAAANLRGCPEVLDAWRADGRSGFLETQKKRNKSRLKRKRRCAVPVAFSFPAAGHA